MKVLIWFRNDLRLHDHAPLSTAIQLGAQVFPVYCFDPRQFARTSVGFEKTGSFRAQFLIESVADLQQSLRSHSSNLIVRMGHPEQVLPMLAQHLTCDAIFYHREVTTEEVNVEVALQKALQKLSVKSRSFWGSTLHDVENLPFVIADLPEVFTVFRKQIEAKAHISRPLPVPDSFPSFPADLEVGECPTLEQLGLRQPSVDARATLVFQGGETAALVRMQHYVWECDRLRVYKQTRNGMLEPNDSSKFSPWLALGCLSPRYIHAQVQQYESKRVKNDSTYWLIFELLWRDYFRWICAKHGAKVFYPSGLRGLKLSWRYNKTQFEQWCQGQTGYPLVDANMRELAATGFMSNRGRQNVASFLTKNLGIHWQMGAEWFESLLIDYDVCSNWGNWNYTAGVGNDARGFRFFNILKQSQDYDPEGKYVKHWLPELAKVPVRKIHRPWELLPIEANRFGVRIGIDYPNPMVDLWDSAKENERLYQQAEARQCSK